MGWYLDNTRIFLQDLNSDFDQIVARLNPADGPAIYHKWGYDSQVNQITVIVVGNADRSSLIAMNRDGNFHVFSGPFGWFGDFLVKKVTTKLLPSICQTIRPDLDKESPLWETTIELWKNE